MKIPPRTSSVLTVFLCAAAFLSFAASASAQDPLQMLNNQIPPEVSNGQAAFVQSLPANHLLYFSIVLPLRNQLALKNLLQRLYNPSDPDYRNFLTVDQFTEQFGPAVDDYNAVVSFAQANGFTVTGTPADRLIVPVSGTAAQIENAFKVKMNVYQHPTESRLFFSPDREPSLNLSVPIKGISGLSNFSIPRPAASKASSPVNVSGSGPGGTSYLPSDMRAAYYGSGSLTGSGQCVGLAEFGGYGISDVVSTFDGYATEAPSGSNYVLTYAPPGGGGPYNIQIANLPLNGANIGTYNSDEAEVVLDIAQAIGMAPGMSQVRVYFAPDAWATSGNDEFPTSNDDTQILNQMVSDKEGGIGCNQLSMSWNWRPENPLNDLDEPVFQTMQSIGQSFFNASGDYGSWTSDTTCYWGSCFVYPEESGNLTAVGGTDLTTSGAGGSWASESGWSNSGGGISPDLFLIPSYQSGLSGINGTSATYRNAPDVAMEANFDNYVCALGSCASGWGGTSFAAPRWAGFTALVNQQAVANGYTPIGFLNPYIYPIGEGPNYLTDFNEIVGGSNGAYSVVTGQYNMVTGWGSPKGQNLINTLSEAPPPPPVNYSPTSVGCTAISGKGGYVTNPAGPETQNGGYAELRTIIQTLHGTLLDAQCTWSGFPAVVTTSPLTLSIPISYGQQAGCCSATLSVSGLAYFDYTSNYNGTELITVPSGTDLSTLSVTGVAIATGGVGDNSELYVGWIDIY